MVPAPALERLKLMLERFGQAHDAATKEIGHRMLNVTRDTGEFLGVLVRATAARRVLEIGTSNGYSTLWLAEAAAPNGGTVTTIESSARKIELATGNFLLSGLASVITQIHDDAGSVLREAADEAYDLIFLDSERMQYPRWWGDLRRTLRAGGLLVVDNATSHALEVAAFAGLVQADPAFASVLVPVGKGEFLAVKSMRTDSS